MDVGRGGIIGRKYIYFMFTSRWAISEEAYKWGVWGGGGRGGEGAYNWDFTADLDTWQVQIYRVV